MYVHGSRDWGGSWVMEGRRMLRGGSSAHLSNRSTVRSVDLRAASSWRRRAPVIDDTGGDVESPAGLFTGFPSLCFSWSATCAAAAGVGEGSGSAMVVFSVVLCRHCWIVLRTPGSSGTLSWRKRASVIVIQASDQQLRLARCRGSELARNGSLVDGPAAVGDADGGFYRLDGD